MLIKIRPPYKERMRQDQAHTRAHDTYGTVTQHSQHAKKDIQHRDTKQRRPSAQKAQKPYCSWRSKPPTYLP